MHPYTKALMGAVFDINMDFSKPIESIESEAPSPLDLPKGCPFQGRGASSAWTSADGKNRSWWKWQRGTALPAIYTENSYRSRSQPQSGQLQSAVRCSADER